MTLPTKAGPAIAVASILALSLAAAPSCSRPASEHSSPGTAPAAQASVAPGPPGAAGLDHASAVPGPSAAAAGPVEPGGTASPAATPAPPSGQGVITPPQAPSGTSQARAIGPMAVATKAIELRVEGVTTAATVGSRQARQGYEFVIVATSWKNVIPLVAMDKKARNPQGVGGLGGFGNNRRPSSDPADITMESTAYVVPELKKHLWLLSDERFADPVSDEAQTGAPGHLSPEGFGIAKKDEVVRGTLVFEAPAGAKYRALQFFDTTYGHVQITLSGAKPAPAALIGGVRQNDMLQLGVSEAGFGPAGREAPAGLRYYTVGLRGVSRSPTDIVDLPFDQSVFLQNDRGCVSQPERNVAELARPFGDNGSFLPTAPNEGQVAFLVPDDTKNVRLLIVPVRGGDIVLPAGAPFTPSYPAPLHTIQDGSTMRVLVLPTPGRPPSLPAPEAGREHVLLDLVVENLKPNKGIEFQTTQQLRLVDPSGGFIQPSPLSNELSCRMGDVGVVPGGNTRRFMLVYDVPAGMPLKLHFRGFEKDEAVVDIKR